ncbi:hypothetical protein RRG08_043391 [Elysia crispata]|uniref:Uncharacterized protein n=1 Tax=Elysia crispata TaxID=231223 RepID=A0AAE1ATW1_9GAST|nr:hypothetical protein RRG08_043391 [Elysia crispata]
MPVVSSEKKKESKDSTANNEAHQTLHKKSRKIQHQTTKHTRLFTKCNAQSAQLNSTEKHEDSFSEESLQSPPTLSAAVELYRAGVDGGGLRLVLTFGDDNSDTACFRLDSGFRQSPYTTHEEKAQEKFTSGVQ